MRGGEGNGQEPLLQAQEESWGALRVLWEVEGQKGGL